MLRARNAAFYWLIVGVTSTVRLGIARVSYRAVRRWRAVDGLLSANRASLYTRIEALADARRCVAKRLRVNGPRFVSAITCVVHGALLSGFGGGALR